MVNNMSGLDRLIRILVAIVLIWLLVAGVITGVLSLIAWILVIIFLITSILGYCPLYHILGISTKKKK